MSGSYDDAYAQYIKEIRRFIEAEKEIPETSESEETESSESSESSDSTSDQVSGNPKPRRILDSSDSDDDYFKAKERKCRSNRIVDSSDTEEDQLQQDSKEPVKIVTSTPLPPAVKRKRTFKRRSLKKREESWRVEENIQRAKQKFLHRTCNAKGEWRRNRTFGIPIEPRGGPISKSNTLPPKQDKVEVEEVISTAVGEPHGSAAKASTSTTRNVFQKQSTVDGDRYADLDLDRDLVRDCSYSPPPSSRWSSSPASDSRASFLSLSNRGPSHASSSASGSIGFRDTSTVPKSPWAKGKLNANPPAAPKIAAPKADAPMADAPEADAPMVAAPKADASDADALMADAPMADAPKVAATQADAPEVAFPQADAAEADALMVDTPMADAPKVAAPKADAPDADARMADALMADALMADAVMADAPKVAAAAPSLGRKLTVQCTRIEHFIILPSSLESAPFVQISGEKFTIKPEQWFHIKEA